MLNFDPMREKRMTMAELTQTLSVADLRALTHEMVDEMQRRIAGCSEADAVFQPADPAARDEAGAAEVRDLAWTLAHVIVHTTASAEESAVLAAGMARGVPVDGRSRYEVPWQTVTTTAALRARLEESRRMRIASLELWPDAPHLEFTAQYSWLQGAFDARGRFVIGLWHDDSHLRQISEIARQSQAARGVRAA